MATYNLNEKLADSYRAEYKTFTCPSCLRKDDYMADARRLLTHLGKLLQSIGWQSFRVETSKGGIAVGGDVTGIYALDETCGIRVQFTAGINFTDERRDDGIHLMAERFRFKVGKPGKKSTEVDFSTLGGRIWINPDHNVYQIASCVAYMAGAMGFHFDLPDPEPVRKPIQRIAPVSLETAPAAEAPIPVQLGIPVAQLSLFEAV